MWFICNPEDEINMKKTVLIYPFTHEYTLFIKKAALLDNIEKIIPVSPKGWGYEGEKVPFRDSYLHVSTDYELNCELCDEVWFINTCIEIDEKKMILPKILFAQKYKKRIINFREANLKNNCMIENENGEKTEVDSGIDIINTPIILTAGLYKNTNISDVELVLADGKICDNYKVVQISSKKEGEAFGMRCFPQFMQSTQYTESEKIILFNRFIKEIELKEKPDLIIIGVPNGVKSYSRDIVEDFGMQFSMIVNAVSVDIMILSTPYFEYTNDDIENIRKLVWNRYGVYVDYIDIVPKRIKIDDSMLVNRLLYLTIDNNMVAKWRRQIDNKDIYEVYEEKEACRLQDNILKRLSGFGMVNFM